MHCKQTEMTRNASSCVGTVVKMHFEIRLTGVECIPNIGGNEFLPADTAIEMQFFFTSVWIKNALQASRNDRRNVSSCAGTFC